MFGVVYKAVMVVLETAVGVVLIYSCATGLFSREGKYDSESTKLMLVSQVVGLLAGFALLAVAAGLVRVPYLVGLRLFG